MNDDTVEHNTEQDLYDNSKLDSKWLGVLNYAKHRGISLAAVQDQIRKNLLTIENGALKETKNGKKFRVWINVKIADEIWDSKVKVSAKNMH